MDPDEAAKLYLKRIDARIPMFETMEEAELNYIKMINAGETTSALTTCHIESYSTSPTSTSSRVQHTLFAQASPLTKTLSEPMRHSQKQESSILKRWQKR